MIRVALMTVLAGAILLAGSPGIRPRSGAADYPAHEIAASAAFGASVIPAAEAKKIFAADLEKAGYVVVEAGVFPAAGRDVDLSAADFTLRTDPNAISERTVDPDAVAASVVKPVPGGGPELPSEEVSVTAGASVQHISGRPGATIVGVDTGVGVGNSSPRYPSSSGADSHRLEQQLWEKSLPDGRTAVPVAGYLYFPKPSKKAKNTVWVLEWQNSGERVKMTLPRQ